MDSNGYVGRFGDTLRRLTALDAQQGSFAPQQVGGADTAGAFSVAPPGPMEAAPQVRVQPAAPAQSAAGSAFGAVPAAPATAPPAFGGGSGAIDESGAMGGSGDTPTTWQDLVGQMPKDQKKAMADQIESHVGDLAGTYRQTALQNGVTPKKNASRMHMALFLGEIALRAAANRGTSGSDGEALAKGVLQTQERRGAIDIATQERARQQAETRRLEGRQDSIRKEGYDQGDITHTRDRAEKLEDDARDHKQALELARMQIEAQKRERAGQNVRIVVDESGAYQLVDLDTKETVPMTTEVEEDAPLKGSRGKGTTGGGKKKVRKPVKALPKTNASGLDQDTVLNKIAAAVKELRGDSKLRRSLKSKGMDESQIDKEIQRMAREQVEGDVQSLDAPHSRGATPATEAANPFDRFDQ